MTLPEKISLRYFTIRGRAQPLRLLLTDAGVAFDDIREPRENALDGSWQAKAALPEIGSIFGTLPVLHWGDEVITQTEAIGWFLGRKLGYLPEGDADAARVMALCSAGHQDLVFPIGMLMWFPIMNPSGDICASAGLSATRMGRVIAGLAQIRRESGGPYLYGDQPNVGDFFIFEALRMAVDVLGEGLLQAGPELASFMEAMEQRPRIKDYAKTRPDTISASPAEVEARKRLKTAPSFG